MIIKIVCPTDLTTSLSKYKQELEDLGYKVLSDEGEIEFEGKTINVAAYNTIAKRDPRSSILKILRKKLIEIQIQKIEESDTILVISPMVRDGSITTELLFEIIIAYYLKKDIYIYYPITYSSLEIISSFNPIFINGDLSKIQQKMGGEKTLDDLLSSFENSGGDNKEESNRIKLQIKS